MPDHLVATGDLDADAYLKYARQAHGLTLVLAEARAHVDAGEPGEYVRWSHAITPINPLGYDRASAVVARAPSLIAEMRKYACWHYRAARDRRAADLADVHVARLMRPPSMDT